MIKVILPLVILFTALPASAQKTEILYLSGTDKDHAVQWDFFCTGGRNSGKWTKIAVPSNWEMKGFGTYNYGRDRKLADEQGLYKYSFRIPGSFRNKRIFIVFEGSMTDTEVKINGKIAGPVHQGSFYRFRYDITGLVRADADNLLEVKVSKMSSDKSVNNAERYADYWIFGGIYRPVYIEAFPEKYIDHLAVNAGADGNISVDVYTSRNDRSQVIEAQVRSLDGEPIGDTFFASMQPGETHTVLKSVISGIKQWNPEFPDLYNLVIGLKEGHDIKHEVIQRFGFRTVEVKINDGIYVNGTKIIFRGVCRHSSWPASGKTMSKEISIMDVNLMKDMNMNAVRMSHYPPDQHFLDVCDSLGLFVLDEIAGWQACYDTEVGKKLVMEMVNRDVNHPSIILWDNGNEGGFNPELREEFSKYDPQDRKVIEPSSTLNGMNTKHYIPYNYGPDTFFNGKDIFFPTELLHGLFDGGLGAGLDDYWNLMLSRPLSAGGFLWVFADEGVVRTDKRDSIDTAGNQAPDGIVGPFREKEGSFFTIKEIWSPVFFEKGKITQGFDGRLKVENRFLYTNLGQCSFSYDLVKYSGSLPLRESGSISGDIIAPPTAPGTTGWLDLKLPGNWQKYDVLFITAYDPHGRLINTWSWNITSPEIMAGRIVRPVRGKAAGHEEGENIFLYSDGIQVSIDKNTGLITDVRVDDQIIPLNKGPLCIGFKPGVNEIKHYREGKNYIVEVIYDKNPDYHIKWTMQPGGWLRMDYKYKPDSPADLFGVTFSYPEEHVKKAILIANGPYHVWKNRLKGTRFGIYEKEYNNTVTGESWNYPEFKGYYSDFYAVSLNTTGLPFTIIGASEDLFLHLFTPQKPRYAIGHVTPPFPEGNISILNGISAIGTKFLSPDSMGPQSQENINPDNHNNKLPGGTVYFKFGK